MREVIVGVVTGFEIKCPCVHFCVFYVREMKFRVGRTEGVGENCDKNSLGRILEILE